PSSFILHPSSFPSVQRLLRLRVVLAADRHPSIVLRRPIELRRKRLGILRRERPIDRTLEFLVLVHVDDVIRQRLLRPAILIDGLFTLLTFGHFLSILLAVCVFAWLRFVD